MLDDEALMLASAGIEMYRQDHLEELAEKLADEIEFIEELAALGAVVMSPAGFMSQEFPEKEA